MKTSIIILLCGAVEYLEAFCHWALYACTQDKEKYALKHLWIMTDLTASDPGLIIKQLWNSIHLKKKNSVLQETGFGHIQVIGVNMSYWETALWSCSQTDNELLKEQMS